LFGTVPPFESKKGKRREFERDFMSDQKTNKKQQQEGEGKREIKRSNGKGERKMPLPVWKGLRKMRGKER